MLLKDSEEKEKLFLEEKNKLVEENKKLKEENDKLKENNKIIKEDYDNKINNIKKIPEIKTQLNTLLDEIKKIESGGTS